MSIYKKYAVRFTPDPEFDGLDPDAAGLHLPWNPDAVGPAFDTRYGAETVAAIFDHPACPATVVEVCAEVCAAGRRTAWKWGYLSLGGEVYEYMVDAQAVLPVSHGDDEEQGL